MVMDLLSLTGAIFTADGCDWETMSFWVCLIKRAVTRGLVMVSAGL